MTDHTSHEQNGQQGGDHQERRSTDSTSATKFPNADRGVVQDGPGTQDTGFADEQDSSNGNLTEAETGRPDPDLGKTQGF